MLLSCSIDAMAIFKETSGVFSAAKNLGVGKRAECTLCSALLFPLCSLRLGFLIFDQESST